MIDLNATFFAQILNFLILVAILRALCYKPVVRMIKAREDKIAESLAKADSDVAEAESLKKDYQAQLAEAREKAQAIVDKAEKVAASNRETSLQDTKREIEQMKKAAQAEIQRDRERAADQLKKEIVALSLLAAGKVVEKNMEASENEALVGDFIDKLDKDKIGDLSC
ncbi:MAG: F0F1 ATP synthase subunit B [Selenomonadaceae bacterium]|uniref:F0F1 ATP synthase subunit B n=1 Tax=Selenomonas TaxID=970 RepID=UPI00036C18CE|nr:F0F1 ATP synthase subunit B [Selenomonas bovis]MBP7249397.1 F0F1 ATP synthase subunit B [Selenomonas sp.]MBQ1620979.1 F0F1 ATP synthase subunit B [Selenomonas sp.]MCI6171474.1 F0F1 ATP synthase subunit B [Selenomonas bovis]MDY6271769.1 F0F1 ATP synthase subunit B [Selenomonadaceae bacterium]